VQQLFQWKSSNYYIFWVCFCRIRYPARNAHAPYCHLWTVRLYSILDCVWNVMAHAQKPDLVFRRKGRVHLNRRGRQFSRLLAAEVCATAVVMVGTLSSVVVWSGVKGTGYPLHSPVSPSLPLPCVIVCHQVSTGL